MRGKVRGNTLQDLSPEKFIRAVNDLANGAMYVPITNTYKSRIFFTTPCKESLKHIKKIKQESLEL